METSTNESIKPALEANKAEPAGPAPETNNEKSARPAMKLWVVRPRDMQAPPFNYSNTPNVMLVAAESADRARDLARVTAGEDDAWLDDERVACEPFAPAGAMVLTTDFRG